MFIIYNKRAIFDDNLLDDIDALVSPILLYACEVIEFDKNDNIENVHLQFLKNILRVRTTTPNYLVFSSHLGNCY
jgi:hypothetical protein